MDSLFPLLSAPVPDRDRPRMRCFSCRSSQERFSSSGMDREWEGNTSFMSLANLLYVQSIVLPLIAVCSYSPTRAGPVIAACPPARERGHPMISGAACGSLLSLLSPPSPPLSLNLVVETRGSVTPLFRHRARPDIVLCEIHRITPQ